VLNSVTKATAGTGLIPFFTAGWFGSAQPKEGSLGISLHELIFQPDDAGLSSAYMSSVYKGSTGVAGVVRRNWDKNGKMMVGTLIVAPAAAALIKKLGRKQINQMNRLLDKTKIPQSIGVKI